MIKMIKAVYAGLFAGLVAAAWVWGLHWAVATQPLIAFSYFVNGVLYVGVSAVMALAAAAVWEGGPDTTTKEEA